MLIVWVTFLKSLCLNERYCSTGIFQLLGIVCLSSLVCLCGHSKKSCMDKAMYSYSPLVSLISLGVLYH